ncbi:hypothetical protein PanWU01x14_123710 [Parasponia andersonii]|uniref:Uncharacterized protein n=1 Tax=Parasponia andersonii TaxID=3476 RepID=A0A2P5CTX2_PARAD|nr:hypothetical protein PanWU01x14_123710 [Parasponia andersonii]
MTLFGTSMPWLVAGPGGEDHCFSPTTLDSSEAPYDRTGAQLGPDPQLRGHARAGDRCGSNLHQRVLVG